MINISQLALLFANINFIVILLSVQEVAYQKPAHSKQKGLFGGQGNKKDKKKNRKKNRRKDNDSDEDSEDAESTEKDAVRGASEPRTR